MKTGGAEIYSNIGSSYAELREVLINKRIEQGKSKRLPKISKVKPVALNPFSSQRSFEIEHSQSAY